MRAIKVETKPKSGESYLVGYFATEAAEFLRSKYPPPYYQQNEVEVAQDSPGGPVREI